MFGRRDTWSGAALSADCAEPRSGNQPHRSNRDYKIVQLLREFVVAVAPTQLLAHFEPYQPLSDHHSLCKPRLGPVQIGQKVFEHAYFFHIVTKPGFSFP